MKIFKKREEIPTGETKPADGAQVWLVTWTSLIDAGYSSTTLVGESRRAKAFLDYQDAEDFAESLKSAMNLLQCSFKINIRIEKQV